jgi:hypothetical protein
MSPSPVLFGLALLAALAGEARADPDAGAPVTPATPAPPPALAEPAWPLGERPRPDGAVQASVADEELARWNVGGSSDPSARSNRPGFHVAPRVKVDTVVRSRRMPEQSSKKGVLSKVGVLAQARNRGYWPFRVCFEAGLRADAASKGKTRVRITLGRDGRASASRLLATELRHPDVATCLVNRARTLRFAPGPTGRTEVDVTVDLSPGDAPLPGVTVPAPPPAASPGKIDVGAVTGVLGTALPAAAACFTRRAARDPKLWGRVGLRVGLGADGAILLLEENESRFPDRDVVACIVTAVRALPFPPPLGGPASFTWGVRLGGPPPPGAPGEGGNGAPSGRRN